MKINWKENAYSITIRRTLELYCNTLIKQDSSMAEFTHSRMSTQYSPVHSSTNSSYSSSLLCTFRTSKEPLEPPESEVGIQSTSGVSEKRVERQASSQSAWLDQLQEKAA
jgi:hypothetical protein